MKNAHMNVNIIQWLALTVVLSIFIFSQSCYGAYGYDEPTYEPVKNVYYIPYSINPLDKKFNLLFVSKHNNVFGPIEESEAEKSKEIPTGLFIDSLLKSLSDDYEMPGEFLGGQFRTTLCYFFEVPYKESSRLGKADKMCIWIPIQDMSQSQYIEDVKWGSQKIDVTLERPVSDFLRMNWEELIAKLSHEGLHWTDENVLWYEHISTPKTLLQEAISQGELNRPLSWPEYKEMLDTMLITGKGDCGSTVTCFQGVQARDCSKEVFKTLDIQLSPAQLREYYNRFGVIVHRYPHEKTLVIGCGNLLPYNKDLLVVGIDNRDQPDSYRYKHAHKGCDTIDPDFDTNPTILCSFGRTNIVPIFAGHKYSRIIVEGIDLLHNLFTMQQIDSLLDEDGILDYNLEIISKQELHDKILHHEWIQGGFLYPKD